MVGRVIPNPPFAPYVVKPLPQRKRLFHQPPPWLNSDEMVFITICCAKRGANQLAQEKVFSIMTGAIEHYVRAKKLWTYLFLTMPDHVHALMNFPPTETMGKVLRDWKRFIAKEAGITWQDGFFDHRLRREESLQEKAHYIRMNPVRAGLAAEPGAWNYVWPLSAIAPAR